MSSFNIVEHTIPCQHIREYARAASTSQESVFHLAVKQYIPKDNPSPPVPGDVTIIGAHANAFPKELYEPLWRRHTRPLQETWLPHTEYLDRGRGATRAE